jgi:hypothetical protein
VDWIHLAEDRVQCRALVNTGMNILVTLNVGNFFTSLTTVSLCMRTLLHGDICHYATVFSECVLRIYLHTRKQIAMHSSCSHCSGNKLLFLLFCF